VVRSVAVVLAVTSALALPQHQTGDTESYERPMSVGVAEVMADPLEPTPADAAQDTQAQGYDYGPALLSLAGVLVMGIVSIVIAGRRRKGDLRNQELDRTVETLRVTSLEVRRLAGLNGMASVAELAVLTDLILHVDQAAEQWPGSLAERLRRVAELMRACVANPVEPVALPDVPEPERLASFADQVSNQTRTLGELVTAVTDAIAAAKRAYS
jgi:hypothetical protein